MKWGWLIKMAWRDSKSSGKKLFLFTVSIVFGIAAFVAIQSFGESLKQNMALQSKALMGADYKIDTDQPPGEELLDVLDSLGGYEAREIAFPSMAAFSSTSQTKLVRVRGIEGAFPLYGQIESQPVNAADTYQKDFFALVDETVMLQFGLQIGDSIKLGYSQIVIGGALKSIPGSNAVFSSIAPPVVVPLDFLKQTRLIQTGSRIDYEFYFSAPPGIDLKNFDDVLDPRLDNIDADLDTHLSTSERLGRRYDNFGKFLNLVAFIALLLGCIGIASSVNIYIREKVPSVVILKCLGAENKQAFGIYLLQVAAIGGLSGLVGSLLGLGIQLAFPLLLEGLLPVDIVIQVHPHVVFSGLVLGFVIAILFSLHPLLKTFYVSPLEAIRVSEKKLTNPKIAEYLLVAAVVAFVFLMSWYILGQLRYALSFMAVLVVSFALLAGVAKLFTKILRRYSLAGKNFVYRQSIKNLFRPQNQTLILIVVIGLGSYLVSTLYFTRGMLLQQAQIEDSTLKPNLIMLDFQTQQVDKAGEAIINNGHTVLEKVPLVTMRLHALRGKSISEWKADSTKTFNNWILNHEYRVTYRSELTDSEKIIEGNWIGSVSNRNAPIPVSISDNLAKDAQLSLGDSLTFNVQGLLMKTYVSSIREVDWGQVQLNFLVLFPKGVLENAPQFWVMSTHVPDKNASAALQQTIVQQFPNVSILDIRQLLEWVEGILNKITWLINFMALFCILTAFVVLLGAIKTSKYQRLKESVLLRTVGATRNQIYKLLFWEYLFLGLLGSISGIVLALATGELLALFLFEAPFVPSLIPFAVVVPSITLAVVSIGVTNSLSAVNSPPLWVLRNEA